MAQKKIDAAERDKRRRVPRGGAIFRDAVPDKAKSITDPVGQRFTRRNYRDEPGSLIPANDGVLPAQMEPGHAPDLAHILRKGRSEQVDVDGERTSPARTRRAKK